MLWTGGTMSRKRTLSNLSVFDTPPASRLKNDEDGTVGGDVEGGSQWVVRSAGSSGGMGNSGLHGIPAEESVSSISRPLPYKHVTFLFLQRSWEELDTSLSTLARTITLLPVLDDEMIKVIKSVLPCLGFRVHTPHVKISNFIILTDELSVKANTPMEVSSFPK